MKVTFQGVNAEELSFKMNRVRLNPQDRVDMKPQFSRQVRRINGNDKTNLLALSIKIESTEAEPKPFDIHATIVGVFDVEDVKDQNEERAFVIEATQTVYPYLRAAVASLTSNAYIMPVHLPVLAGPLFPEDREFFAFPSGSDVN